MRKKTIVKFLSQLIALFFPGSIRRKKIRLTIQRYFSLPRFLRPHWMKSLHHYYSDHSQIIKDLATCYNPADFAQAGDKGPDIELASRWKTLITNNPSRILEVGSYQGASTVLWAYLFPKAHLTCVDFWQEDYTNQQQYDQIETVFDTVTTPFANRLHKIKSDSAPALTRLADTNERFDLIYIDAGHFEDNALIDTMLAWRLLDAGGVMVWDDYWLKNPAYNGKDVRPAVNHFLARHQGEYKVLSVHKMQVMVEKLPVSV